MDEEPLDAELFTDPDAFEAAAAEVIAQDPVTATVPATLLARRRFGEALSPESLWFVLREGDRAVGIACQTPPWPLFLGAVPPGREQDAAAALVDAYLVAGRDPGGANGEKALAAAFAQRWQARTGRSGRIVMAQLSYVLSELVDPEPVAGQARRATAGDIDLLVEWFEAFHAEIEPTAPRIDERDTVMSRLDGGAILLWERDGRPVAMAGVNPPAAGVVRIGPVYTVPEERRKGIAANVTAAATRTGFDLGARLCMLYTDAANPTSNGVYQRLGYRLVGESTRWRFDA